MAPTGDFYEAALRSEHQKNKHRLWLADVVNRLSGRYVSKCAELTIGPMLSRAACCTQLTPSGRRILRMLPN